MTMHVHGRFLALSVFVVLVACAGCGGDEDADPGGEAGNAGAAGSSGAGGSGGASSLDLLIDDFEDGDGRPLVGSGWYTYADPANGGSSIVTIPGAPPGTFAMTGEGYQSERSLEVEYQLDQGNLAYDPYIGLGVSIGSAATPRDLSLYDGISYAYRGAAHMVKVETYDVVDYDYFMVSLAASANWTTVTLPLSAFAQEGWGKAVAFAPSNAGALSFHVRGRTGDAGRLQLDNLKVVGLLPDAGPDMPLNDPAPPVDGVIDSIEVANPLQAKAMRYLTRGYNITNWLEQRRFAGFDYDETFVEQLAKAGFKSVRLPIDLDLYAETTGSGDSLAVSVHEDLFTILDAFDTWTENHGLSLTIDYHQYDKSLVLADADEVSVAVQLWGKVAEHFAARSREDLFFELLNEPELSLGGPAPTQAQWSALAERMISAIREHDTEHTIIFGDVEWYGIGPLSRREPLADTNVIYAFHDYEPFVFTHQGAAWANLSTAHDVPYPYSKDRWSQYYADLGFTAFMEPWILGQVQGYFRTGNRASLRNGMLAAKRWAVEHDVPVICNEFGAYDGTSRLEDRVRYYTDLIGIFEELAIPWQHWFMIMDPDGNVIPEYRAAFKLDE